MSYDTQILSIDISKIGQFVFSNAQNSFLADWDIRLSTTSSDAKHLLAAASLLRSGRTPLAFPTETVYGLGADATCTAAVLGIYSAKERPADNPLIVHISSLSQLRKLLIPPSSDPSHSIDLQNDPIPSIYRPLILRFWPGPLTIILPLPRPSRLAPPVTASLSTFGARMPSSLLALALIHLADLPLAAPSANTSTKPSPTTAAHVLQDLSGRIELILDSGPCEVGIESTVVNGLTQPPLILRPGAVSIEKLRECAGWENVAVGYMKESERGVPRAPGMKYRHYSPSAKVILVEGALTQEFVERFLRDGQSIGIITSKLWTEHDLSRWPLFSKKSNGGNDLAVGTRFKSESTNNSGADVAAGSSRLPCMAVRSLQARFDNGSGPLLADTWIIALGQQTAVIARGLFSALRELDLRGVATIFVEGINDSEGDAAAAVMNRLRKAAEMEHRA